MLILDVGYDKADVFYQHRKAEKLIHKNHPDDDIRGKDKDKADEIEIIKDQRIVQGYNR